MGRQVLFYLLPDDLPTLEESIQSKHDIRRYELSSSFRQPVPANSIAKLEMGRSPLTLVMARPQDEAAISMEEIDPTRFKIDVLRSPVIELSRCYFDGKILRRGRAYYTTGYFAADRSWVEKSAAFLKWADSIFRTIRKTLFRDAALGALLGEHARRWRDEGGTFVSL